MRGIVVLSAAIWLAFAPAFARTPAERGWNTYLAGRHAEAWRELKPLADQGDASAQYYVGSLYQPGLEKALEAYKWFELAARASHPSGAQNRDRLVERLNSQELRQAKAMADAWQPPAGNVGKSPP